MLTVKGVNAAPWLFTAPAWKLGLNGCGFAHGEPPGPEVMLNSSGLSRLLTAGVPDHGVKDACVVNVPQERGVAIEARGPLKSSSSSSSKGSCGALGSVFGMRPVLS